MFALSDNYSQSNFYTNFNPMKKFLFALLCLICVSDLSAQDDTTKLVYDVIYTKDGRVFEGEILSFNENNGTIIFKNND